MAKMRPTSRMLVLALLLTTAVWLFPPQQPHSQPFSLLRGGGGGNTMCASVGASLGLFLGDTASSLQPLDLLGVQGPAAWPVCNPIFTAGGLKSYDGVAGPSLFQYQNRLFMFYEAISCGSQRRAIGIAESYDEGVTWRGLGSILSSKTQDSLRRPHVFTYNNEIFMVSDGKEGAKLHRCLKFPMSWHLNATLTTDPLRGVSIIKSPVLPESGKDVEEEEERWLMVGSISSSAASASSFLSAGGQWMGSLGRRGNLVGTQNGVDLPIEDDMIAVYIASSPLGPWRRHEQSPFHVHAASPGGGLAILPTKDSKNNNTNLIIRLGRSCTGAGRDTCSDVVASKFDFTEGTLKEEPLTLPPHPNFLGERVWRQRSGWDGGQRAEATVASLPSGKVAAIVLGKPGVHIRPWYAPYLEFLVIFTRGALVGCLGSLVAMIVLKKGGKNILRSRGGSGGGATINRRAVTVSPNGISNINGSSGNGAGGGVGGSSGLPGGYTPKASSLAIQRLQAEERGEIHQPISPRGRAVLTSRAAARNGEGAAGTSAGAALAADLASRFAAFAMPSSTEKDASVLPSSSSSSSSPRHLKNTSITAPSPLSSTSYRNTLRRRRHQLRLVFRGAVQRWAISLLQATPRQIISIIIFSFCVSIVTFAVGRVHTVFYPFWAPAPPTEVGGQFSRFTLLVMSYESRRSLLEGYVRQYHQCPSVGEILIVWNQDEKIVKGSGKEKLTSQQQQQQQPPPPEASRDFSWASVPIRVRTHSNNSLTNRYLPDDQLRFRGVLSLDDDQRVTCADVERAFARWRSSPSSLTGYVPRLAEVSNTPRYQTEQQAIDKGWYNLILTGAAFIDSRSAFSTYWSDSKSMHDARALVDRVHNCDDILMNFVVANSTVSRTSKRSKKQGSVLYVRPSRRLDVSWQSGVGLSHSVNHFLQDAENCLIEFEKIFGRWPLRAEEFDWAESEAQGAGGKPKCTKGKLDCSYLSF